LAVIRARIVLRVDGDAHIGVGHAVRSLTLGRALAARGLGVTIVSVSLPEVIAAHATRRGISVEIVPAEAVAGRIERLRPQLVVVDGYHLSPVVEHLAAGGVPTAIIDDNHELPLAGVQLVLNQNLHATMDLYQDAFPAQRFLLGADYVLLRSDVMGIDPRRNRDRANRVLVALGGADPEAITEKLATELVRRTAFEVSIGIGAANPRRTELTELAGQHSTHLHLDSGDLVDGYGWADLAVISAGTTMWEVGFLGLPAVALVVAENQRAGAQAAASRGFLEAVDVLGGADIAHVVDECERLASDAVRRGEMSAIGRALFDGNGASRVADEIESLVIA
jgi:UDP-2,4-diacetamido-2,4,6-trideoxy-beta-L-altropyranose hydrolase